GMGAGFSVRAAPVAAPAGPTYRIRGLVVDAAGAPVVGVKVSARRTGFVYEQNDPKTWGDWASVSSLVRAAKEIDAPSAEEEKPTVEGKSGEGGAFLLET